jgi:hypothetical protein
VNNCCAWGGKEEVDCVSKKNITIVRTHIPAGMLFHVGISSNLQ